MTTNDPNLKDLIISVATPSDGSELTRLLQDAYRQSTDFTMQSDTFFHEHFKERTAVVIARVGLNLLGTMRADLILGSEDLSYEDEGFLLPDMVPALLLCRAATVSDHRASGLNSVMRAYCIEAAMSFGLQSVIGEVYRNAPRTKLMAELGYSFFPLKAQCDVDRTYHSECLFATLAIKQAGASALDILRSRNSKLERRTTWLGPSLADVLIASAKDGAPASMATSQEDRFDNFSRKLCDS